MKSIIYLVLTGVFCATGFGQDDAMPVDQAPAVNWGTGAVEKAFSQQTRQPVFSSRIESLKLESDVWTSDRLKSIFSVDAQAIAATSTENGIQTDNLLQPNVSKTTTIDDDNVKNSSVVMASYLQDPPSTQDSKNESPDKDPNTAQPKSTDLPEPQSLIPTSVDLKNLSIASLSKKIEEHKTFIGSEENLDETIKKTRLDVLSNAARFLQNTGKFQVELAGLRQQIDDLKKFDPKLERENLSKSPVPETPPKDADTSSELLAKELQAKKLLLDTVKTNLEAAENSIKERDNRVTIIATDRNKATQRLKEIESKIASASGTDEDTQLSLLLFASQKLAATTELAKLDAESEYQELAGTALPVQRDQVQRRLARLQSEIGLWEKSVVRLRNQEIQKQAEEARIATMNAHPALKSLAMRNQELASLRKSLDEKIQAIKKEQSEITSKTDQLQSKFDSLLAKIKAVGLTDTNGMLLVEHRRSLMPSFENAQRISTINAELKQVNLNKIQLSEERKPLADLPGFVEDQLLSNGSQPNQRLIEMGSQIANDQKQFLDALIVDYNEYRRLLGNVAIKREELTKVISESRQFVDKNALWLRSSDSVCPDDMVKAQAGFASFFRAANWINLGTNLKSRVISKPHEFGLGCLGLCCLFVITRKFRPKDQ